MKEKLKRYLAITDRGVNDSISASKYVFLKYITFIMPPMLTFYFLQNLIEGKDKPMWIYLAILIGIVLLMYVVIFREYTRTYDATYEESVNLRLELANKLKELPLSYFSTHNLSDISQTVMMDVSNIEMVISHALPSFVGFVAFFVVMTCLMLISCLPLGLTVTVPIWAAIGCLFLSKKAQRKRTSKYYNRLLDNSNAFQNAFEMQQEIKSYSMQEETRRSVNKKIEDTESIHIKAEFFMGAIATAIGILPYLSVFLTAIIGAKLYMAESVSILYYAGFLMAGTTISHQFANISEFILMFFFFEDSFDRLRSLKSEPIQLGEDKKIENYDIEFRNVEFKYKKNKVIDGTSFLAKQNQVTAIVGPSGCGKTTVLRLLSRLYDYDKGQITIGNEDIKMVSTKSLFDNISIVFQNVELFNCSVMENIRMGRKEATDEEVLEAAALANVDEITDRLPEGYETIIGENGSKLSGGERQRISIARAFLKNAPIILLDEISASLDVENEMEIQESLNKLTKDKTVIIISHRLKSIENADKIIVMNEGRVESEGTHNELMEKSVLYSSMVEKSRLTENFLY